MEVVQPRIKPPQSTALFYIIFKLVLLQRTKTNTPTESFMFMSISLSPLTYNRFICEYQHTACCCLGKVTCFPILGSKGDFPKPPVSPAVCPQMSSYCLA